MPDRLTVAAFERSWMTGAEFAQAESLVVDLTDCRQLDQVTLGHLIGHMAQRRHKGLLTTIRLPKFRPMRDLLRTWEFPQALTCALNERFRDLLTVDSLKYLSEAGAAIEAREGRYLPINVIPFQTITKASAVPQHVLVARASERWRAPYIQAVLSRELGPVGGKRLSTHVINESLINAVRHPNAALLQTAAAFSRNGNGVDKFTYVVWDNGESIISTLQRVFQYGELKSAPYPEVHRDYRIRLVDAATGKEENVVTNTATAPTDSASPQQLLIAATYPGIAGIGERDRDTGLDASSRDRVQSRLAGRRGIGLSVLINTVIDVFGGEVSVRTGNLFMNIRGVSPAEPGDKRPKTGEPGSRFLGPLEVEIVEYPTSTSTVKGNILAVRVPLKR